MINEDEEDNEDFDDFGGSAPGMTHSQICDVEVMDEELT